MPHTIPHHKDLEAHAQRAILGGSIHKHMVELNRTLWRFRLFRSTIMLEVHSLECECSFDTDLNALGRAFTFGYWHPLCTARNSWRTFFWRNYRHTYYLRRTGFFGKAGADHDHIRYCKHGKSS